MLQTTHFAPTPGKLSGSRLSSMPVISVTSLAGVPAFVRETFGERVLMRANEAAMLDIEAIEDQDCFIPHITLTTFAGALAKHSGEEEFGLRVAPHLSITNYGCWGEYILGAPTLGAAIERATSTAGYHSRGDAFSVAIADGQVRLSYASAAKGQDGYRHGAQRRRHTFSGRDAHIDGPRSDLRENVEVGHAPKFDAHVRLLEEEYRQRRQQDVSVGFVAADPQDRAGPLRHLPDRGHRFIGHSKQLDRFGQQRIACLRELRGLRAAIEQDLAQVVFKAADSLAHSRLGSTESHGGPREAAFGRDGDEDFEFSELHRPSKSKRAITRVG